MLGARVIRDGGLYVGVLEWWLREKRTAWGERGVHGVGWVGHESMGMVDCLDSR